MDCTVLKITEKENHSWLTVKGKDGIFIQNYIVQVSNDHGLELNQELTIPKEMLRPIHSLGSR